MTGSPQLDKVSTRTEADALRDRIERATLRARDGLHRESEMFRRDPLSMGIPAGRALEDIIRILEGK